MKAGSLGLLIALTALAAAGRLLLLALPNISLTFFVVAVAALAYGPRMGAAVGGLAMLLTSAMLSGPAPGPVVAAGVVAALAAGVGALRTVGFPGAEPRPRTWVAAALLGVAFQVAFSLAADSTGWFLFAFLPEGPAAIPLLAPVLAAGLLFNIPAAAFQAALFAGALQPVVQALRAAGLADAPSPRVARRVREVVLADAH